MKTVFAACLKRLGLSQPAAAEYLNVSEDTLASWRTGRREVPDGIWPELRSYEDDVIDRSEAIKESWEDAGEPREIKASCDDHKAIMAIADFILSGANDENAPIPINKISLDK